MAAGRPPSVPNRGSYQFQPGTWHSVVPLALSNNKTLKNSSRVPSEMHVRTFLKTCSCDLLGIAKVLRMIRFAFDAVAFRVFCEMGSWFKPICHRDFPWTPAFVRQGEGILRYFEHQSPSLATYCGSCHHWMRPTKSNKL